MAAVKRYFIYKGKRFIGGLEITQATATYLEKKGYRLVPA